VFDAKGPTFRDALYPSTRRNRAHAGRPARPDSAHPRGGALLGWKVLDVPGVEADDVIGTLAAMAAQQGIEVIVSSGDKDLSQLVNEHITIIDTMNGKRRDVAGVEAEFGVPPRLMVDYQTLVGDAVDNVPGVEKVGPKTAAKWLQEYGSLDALVARAARSRAWPARTCARHWTGYPGPVAADHQDRLRSVGACSGPACAGRDSYKPRRGANLRPLAKIWLQGPGAGAGQRCRPASPHQPAPQL
jgi:5'-3' exonuclease